MASLRASNMVQWLSLCMNIIFYLRYYLQIKYMVSSVLVKLFIVF